MPTTHVNRHPPRSPRLNKTLKHSPHRNGHQSAHPKHLALASPKFKIKNHGRGKSKKDPSQTPATNPARPPRTPTPHGLRIAAIDIGTNSLHMVIVEVTDSLAFKVLSSDKDLTNLGSDALVKH